MNLLRFVGLFLANLLAAVLGTAVIESAIPPHSGLGALFVKDSVVAFALGYFVYRLLKSATGKWVWIAGLCWFGERALGLWLDQSTVRTMTGNHGVAIPVLDWINYGVPFLRTALYSLGAFLSSRIGRPVPLDPQPALSDHDSNAHPTPPADVRDALRADSTQGMDRP
jgi:hypothetical protein